MIKNKHVTMATQVYSSDASNTKQLIIDRFNKYVRGKKPNISGYNIRHDGGAGYWLETQMQVNHNANNAPDIGGFEMKCDTSSKTTFGDWSAHYYIFKDPRFGINRDHFMKIFGHFNSKKKRHSWSGTPVPKINGFNDYGQILALDTNQNICAVYSFSKDQRNNKSQIVPEALQLESLVLAQWDYEWMKTKVEDKFNKSGWFKCKLNSSGIYHEIVFGPPITYEFWLKGVKQGLIFFDSGMYEGNSRNYSQWRAFNQYWDSMVIEKY